MKKTLSTILLLGWISVLFGVFSFADLRPAAAKDELNLNKSIKFRPQVGIGDGMFKACTDPKDTSCGVSIKPDTIGNFVRELYKYAIGLVGILAVVAMMGGGIMRIASGGNPAQVQSSNQIITGALTGLVIALSSYTILFFINPDLVKLSLISPTPPPLVPGAAKTENSTPATQLDATTWSAGAMNTADATAALVKAKIGIKPGVGLNGIQGTTINELIALKQEVGIIDVTVTSATEGTHEDGKYDHAGGYKADVRLNSSLTKYIESTFTKKGIRSDDKAQMYQSPRGTCYAKEGDHWDITTQKCPH